MNLTCVIREIKQPAATSTYFGLDLWTMMTERRPESEVESVRRLFALASAILLLLVSRAHAVEITVDFSGHIIDRFGTVPVALSNFFAIEDSFSGSYSYSSDLESMPVPNTGIPPVVVYNGIADFRVTINGFTYAQTIGHFEIANDSNLGTTDSIIVRNGIFNDSFAGRPMIGLLLNSHQLTTLTLNFFDRVSTGSNALTSTGLPLGAPDLSVFPDAIATFSFFDLRHERRLSHLQSWLAVHEECNETQSCHQDRAGTHFTSHGHLTPSPCGCCVECDS